MAFRKRIFQLSKIMVTVLILIIMAGCEKPLTQKGDTEYIKSIEDWHMQRIENLKKPNGWLNLVGLYWLNEGDNSFGSSSSNDVVFPAGSCEAVMGTLILKDGEVTLKVNPGVEIKCDDKSITEMILQNDESGNETILKYGTLAWFIIKRENKIGVRLRDYEAELVKTFEEIDTYPINDDWLIEAKFVTYDPPKKITVPSIIGTITESDCYGKLVFKKNGQTFSLDPMGEDYLFLVFADETNGIETYGAGRFLSVEPPDSTGKTFIDFNKAYNPPCAFTKYATCPLPPKDNYLKLEVTAGEKKYGNH